MSYRSKLTFSQIRPYLDNLKQVGRQYRCACPYCEDAKGHHLYVKVLQDDGFIVFCQKSNCRFKDIIDEIRRRIDG